MSRQKYLQTVNETLALKHKSLQWNEGNMLRQKTPPEQCMYKRLSPAIAEEKSNRAIEVVVKKKKTLTNSDKQTKLPPACIASHLHVYSYMTR